MKLSKIIARSPVTPYLIAGIALAVGRTWKIKVFGKRHIKKVLSDNKKPIFAFWHGRLMPLSYTFRGQGIYILSSESRDGQLSIKANRALGYKLIGGSTSKGGMRGLREITRVARSGASIGITPDGPRGPAQKLHEGLMVIAMTTGNPIIPVSASASRPVFLRSWDRFLIPLPFSRLGVILGKPIYVPRRMSREMRQEYLQHIENVLNHLQNEADRMMGNAVPEM